MIPPTFPMSDGVMLDTRQIPSLRLQLDQPNKIENLLQTLD
jgi:hypothetical protein